uniref:RING-type E3 ubiquitin transferase n=1 Tax=Vitis vinifera TaxID=29760 RepID=A5BMT2_VITVI|nr:hypothetical protein VITISV_037014 [Vitis vinifera]
MEGDERRQGPSHIDRSLKRSASESGLSSSGRQREESTSNTSSNSTATPGVGMGELSSMLAGPSSAAGTGEILERILRRRTNPPNQQDLEPTAPEQRRQHSGGSNTEQAGQQNNSFWQSRSSLWQRDPTQNPGQVVIILDAALAQGGGIPQVNDPRIRSRLISEVHNAMGLQGRGGTIQYRSHTRFPGYWRLLDVIYLPDENEDEDDENDDMRLDIDNMSYEFWAQELLALGEHIGNVSTGLSKEVIMARLKQRKYICLATGPCVGEKTCCICQEEYADDDDIGKLDCEHEYHVACIREWLVQKNSCPICKKTALAT